MPKEEKESRRRNGISYFRSLIYIADPSFYRGSCSVLHSDPDGRITQASSVGFGVILLICWFHSLEPFRRFTRRPAEQSVCAKGMGGPFAVIDRGCISIPAVHKLEARFAETGKWCSSEWQGQPVYFGQAAH